MSKLDLVSIFQKLQPFYILIYVHDLQEFDLEELNGLAIRLQGKLELDQRQKMINQKLTQASTVNYEQKKKKKKKAAPVIKNQILEPSFLKAVNKSLQIDDIKLDSFSIEESVIYPEKTQTQKWSEVSKFPGVIYDGKLTIMLPIKYKENVNQKISFQVDGTVKTSFISMTTLEKLKKTQKVDKIQLSVAQYKHDFEVKGTENILGLDFLIKHKVVLNCNYRPQVHKFTLAFTS